jgi:SAM-dependent methyltransferase
MPRTAPFEIHAAQYENWFNEHLPVYQSELEAVSHFLPAGGTGVEIGVGSGRFAAPLGIKFGVEPSPGMGRLAAARGIKVYNAVAEALPLPSASFDYALLVTTICFVDDITASFREAARVLKPNGSIIIGFVDRDSPLGKTYETHKAGSVFYREATFYATCEVFAHLDNAGFAGAEAVQTVFGPLQGIRRVQRCRPGFGAGGFVVIHARIES